MTTDALHLTILRHGETIVMDFADVDPVVLRSQIRVEQRLLDEITDELARLTALSNTQAALSLSYGGAGDARADGAHIALQRLGELIFAHLFPAPAQRRLTDAAPTDLFLRLDDQLVHIPWELACDGRDFLLTKFHIGRQVISQQQHRMPNPRALRGDDRLRILIVVDPTETLSNAADEAEQLCAFLDECPGAEYTLLSGKDLRKIDLLGSLAECDVVHYAGHAFFDAQNPSASGWVLQDTVLTALDISKVRHPPCLVFSNACQAGATTPWEADAIYQEQAFGIGSGFLLAGTQNYIGSFCVIYDASSAAFAGEFYRHLLQGETVGMALHAARIQARAPASGGGLLWASYLHYGNPLFRLHMATPEAAATGVRASGRAEGVVPEIVLKTARQLSVGPEDATDVQGSGTTQQGPEPGVDSARGVSPAGERGLGTGALRRRDSRSSWLRPRRLAVGAAVLVTLLLATGVLLRTQGWRGGTSGVSRTAEAYRALDQGDWQEAETLFRQQMDDGDGRQKSEAYAGLAAVAFAHRDYSSALDFARQAEVVDPEIVYSHVIRGHILWHQGQIAEAGKAYHTALTKPHGTSWQYAMAHERLGRINAAQGNTQPAIEHYDHAISWRGDMASTYANKAHLLETLGRHQEATALYRQAQRLDPADPLTSLLLQQLIRREQLAQDHAKREQLRQQLNELAQAAKEGKGRQQRVDAWTSIPLTLAVRHAPVNGLLLTRGGAEVLLTDKLGESLRASKRVEVVDRAWLAEILEEQGMMAQDELTDRTSGLRLGKLLPARVQAWIRLMPSGGRVDLSIRVSETETGRSIYFDTYTFDDVEAPDGAVDHIARGLLSRLQQEYPLQGRIDQVASQEVQLNIGARHGVTSNLILEVFADDALRSAVGRVQVTRVEGQRSWARVLEQRERFQPEWKVKEEQK